MSFETLTAKNLTKYTLFFFDDKWVKRSEYVMREYSRFLGCIFEVKDLHYTIEKSAKDVVLKYIEVGCVGTSQEDRKLELAVEYLKRPHLSTCGNRNAIYRPDELSFIQRGILKLTPARCHKCGDYRLSLRRTDVKHMVCYQCYQKGETLFPYPYGFTDGWCCQLIGPGTCGSKINERGESSGEEDELILESPEEALVLAECVYKEKSPRSGFRRSQKLRNQRG